MNSKLDTKLPIEVFMVDSENFSGNSLIQQCFNMVGVFVIAVDLKGNISLINTNAEELLESDRDDIIGKNFIGNFIVEEKREETRKIFDSITAGSSIIKENIKFYIQGKTSKNKIIESKNVAIRDKDNNLLGILISGKDITDYIKKQRDLQTDIYLYRILANNIPDINLFLFDKEMRFILAEGNEMKNNDFSRDYFENRKLKDLSDNELKKIWTPLFKSALLGKEVSVEYNFNNYYYNMWVLPVFSKNGEIEKAVAINQNITEDKRIERQLKKSKEAAEKANQSKSDFLARVSHEIRTPLNAILGFSEQLKQSQLDSQQREFITIIDKSSEHLLSLINDILVLSKIEARQIRFNKSPFKLSYTIKYVYDALLPKAEEKKLSFTYHVDNRLEMVLLGDSFRLRQILINMLSNAIKFTNNGYVELKCFLLKETKNDVKVGFEIIDTGIGISPKNHENIFDKFKQADSTIIKRYGGTGLGLAICKNLIELQNGSLSVSSEEGIGSTFSFTIHYMKGKSKDIIPEDIGDIDLTKLKNKKTLLVDDDNYNRLLGKTMLDKFECITDISSNGKNAIEKLRKNKYDIVLLDIHMQSVSGIEVAEFIRKKNNDKSTKILAVTAAVMKDDILKYYQVGIDDFLIKPFKEINLYNKMCDVLKIAYQKKKPSKSKVIVKENSNIKLYDLSELKRMAGGNETFIKNMLTTFIENSENSTHLFKQFLETKDWKKIGETAHKILPSYKHLKVEPVISKLVQVKTKTMLNPDYKNVPRLVEKTIKEMKDLLDKLKKEIS
jgi:PAS domain S-box-containing protein